MDGMGQRPLFPPNVSGWKANGYWINASAAESRARAVQQFIWTSSRTYWSAARADRCDHARRRQHHATGEITDQGPWPAHVPVMSAPQLVDRFLQLTGLAVERADLRRARGVRHPATVWERQDALMLLLLAPDMHVA